jgi:endonuclease-3
MKSLVFDKNLSINFVMKADYYDIVPSIYKVRHSKKKCDYIMEATKTIVEEFDSKVPDNLQDLMKLKGIGPKMAHLFMELEYGVISGLSANTHVHRIANRLKWVKNPTKDPN